MPMIAIWPPTLVMPQTVEPLNCTVELSAWRVGRCQDLPSAVVYTVQPEPAVDGESTTTSSPLTKVESPPDVVRPVGCHTTPDEDQYHV